MFAKLLSSSKKNKLEPMLLQYMTMTLMKFGEDAVE